MPEFINLENIFTVLHLIGVILGMGAAFMTDIMFINSTKDKVLTNGEISFIALGSRTVWMGLFLIIISGLVLFFLEPAKYLESSKFLSKMTVVGVLTINGLFFHFKHLPFLKSQVDVNLTKSQEFISNSKWLFISGAISTTSWLAALVLGSLRRIPFELDTILICYTVLLLVAIPFSLVFRKIFLKTSTNRS